MKGHSERVPGKNIRLLHSRPLFYHVLDALAESGVVDPIVVNTDSEEIADLAMRWGSIVVHRRPPELCGDFVPMTRIIAHDLSSLADADVALQTHSTNPLLRAASIRAAVQRFAASDDCDSLYSVTRIQSRLWWDSGQAINHDPTELRRTQDLPPVFEENSCFYIFRRAVILNLDRRIGEHPLKHELAKTEAIDIDTEEDWLLAEAMMNLRRQAER